MSNNTMNITKDQQIGKCDETCSYSYKYQTSSNCNASNNKDNISLVVQ